MAIPAIPHTVRSDVLRMKVVLYVDGTAIHVTLYLHVTHTSYDVMFTAVYVQCSALVLALCLLVGSNRVAVQSNEWLLSVVYM